MIKNYFKTAWRNLLRNRLLTLIHVSGLTFGISCFLLIGLYLFDEYTYDHQHKNIDRIYRVIEQKNVRGAASKVAAASYNLAEQSKKNITGVENITRISRTGRANLVDPLNPVYIQENVTVADENFFKIFDFELLEGDRNTVLDEPNTIVITESLAMRIFNTRQVTGRSLDFGFMDTPLKITGILRDLPRNSSFDFTSLISDASFRQTPSYKNMVASDWSSTNFSVYALLRPMTDPAVIASKMSGMVLDHYQPEAGTSVSYYLQPLKDMHLYSEGILDGGRNSNVAAMVQGNPWYLKIFGWVAIFVLMIACINYMNLSTAGASDRSKEIGVRKAIGALRSNLISQFFMESFLITGISFLLAILVVVLVLPSLNQFTGKALTLGFHTDYRIWMYAAGTVGLVGLISGSYPAMLLSKFKPLVLLKSMKLNLDKSFNLRRGLVVFQFVISTVMIIGTIVLFLQVRFLNSTNLGFNKDLLVVIDVNSNKARTGFETIKTEMKKIPSVKGVSVTSRVPGEWKTIRMVKLKMQGSTEDLKESYLIGADEDFTATFEAEIIKGRNFKPSRDSASILLNETAAALLNITEPTEQMVEIPLSSRRGDGYDAVLPGNQPFRARVVGIVKDFHFQSLRDKIAPLILANHLNPVHNIDYCTARIQSENIPATLEKLKAVMLAMDANDPFEYHFLDQQLALFYLEDYRRQTLLIWVALSTIFIACLGLFGLATFAARQRIKEIGVRKVLGATVFNLASLLSKDFLKLVLIANGLAFPIGWYVSEKWLREFAYHIDIKWWVFALAGATAIFIALSTVSYQAIKAAMTNPIHSLKTE